MFLAMVMTKIAKEIESVYYDDYYYYFKCCIQWYFDVCVSVYFETYENKSKRGRRWKKK